MPGRYILPARDGDGLCAQPGTGYCEVYQASDGGGTRMHGRAGAVQRDAAHGQLGCDAPQGSGQDSELHWDVALNDITAALAVECGDGHQGGSVKIEQPGRRGLRQNGRGRGWRPRRRAGLQRLDTPQPLLLAGGKRAAGQLARWRIVQQQLYGGGAANAVQAREAGQGGHVRGRDGELQRCHAASVGSGRSRGEMNRTSRTPVGASAHAPGQVNSANAPEG